jgi:hypothetical protein
MGDLDDVKDGRDFGVGWPASPECPEHRVARSGRRCGAEARNFAVNQEFG